MVAHKTSVLHEITPLSESSCLYVTERKKTEFNYPIHTHKEFEINYIENAAGAQRIVGDSIEEIGEYELVMCFNLQYVPDEWDGESNANLYLNDFPRFMRGLGHDGSPEVHFVGDNYDTFTPAYMR